MGRQQNIDRNAVLDAAEQIVLTHGAADLSMDAVARAAGITKGGVQYCFGSKRGMIDAMVERWCRQFQDEIDERTPPVSDPVAAVRGYVEATASINKNSHARAAGLMAMLLQSPEHMETARTWYREHLQPLDLSTPEGRQARIAFMAMEGAFVLRSFGFMSMKEDEWSELYAEIMATLPSPKKKSKKAAKPAAKGTRASRKK
ncbi:MAG: TetR/AcrR family transcriptional regulator [Puniceicoccales bacterium]